VTCTALGVKCSLQEDSGGGRVNGLPAGTRVATALAQGFMGGRGRKPFIDEANWHRVQPGRERDRELPDTGGGRTFPAAQRSRQADNHLDGIVAGD
jgi:hypothetical protein